MKIIHSFWSLPVFPNGFGKGGITQRNFSMIRSYFLFWSFSCLKLVEQYGQVSLVTDDLGKRLLIDELELPYTSVSLDLNSLKHMPPDLWSLGKLHTYSLQDMPFIHVDGDFFIWSRFTQSPTPPQILAMSPEIEFSFYQPIVEHIATKCRYKPDGLFVGPPYNSINSGVLGGSQTSPFRELYNKVLDLFFLNKNSLSSIELRAMNLLTDQYFLYNMVQKSTPISYVLNEMSEDYNECLNLNLVPHHSKYVHLVGEAKNDKRIQRFIEIIFEVEFPRQYFKFQERIFKIVNNEGRNILIDPIVVTVREVIKRNYLVWKNSKRSSLYDVEFRLSNQASVQGDAEAPQLIYYCIVEGHVKYKKLSGSALLLAYLGEPASARTIVKKSSSNDLQEKYLIDVLNLLTHYAFYYGVLEIIED